MALAVVHHQSGINTIGIPGSISLGWTPTPGNMIVVFMHCNLSTSAVTVNSSSWPNTYSQTDGGTNTLGMLLGRYVQGGDTSSLPALWTAGFTYWAYDVYEISGVSGTWASDVQIVKQVGTTGANVTSLSTASVNTASNNCLALCGGGQYNGNHNPTLNAGWTTDETGHNSSNYGSTVGGSWAVATSGTAIVATASFTDNLNPADLFAIILQPAVLTATGVQASTAARAVTPRVSPTLTHALGTAAAPPLHAGPVIVIALPAGTTTWTVPNDWDSTNNKIEGIGAGGNGAAGVANTSSGGSGGSGSYARKNNVVLTPGSTVTVNVDAGGTGNAGGQVLVRNNANTVVMRATSGGNASGSTAGAAPTLGTLVGDVTTQGKAGRSGNAATLKGAPGGSGACGPAGVGEQPPGITGTLGGEGGGGCNTGTGAAVGTATTGGQGGNGSAGTGGGAGATTTTPAGAGSPGGGGGGSATLADNAGGNGGNEVTWTITAGGTAGPGGGGGGGGASSTTAGAGGNGGTGGGGGGGASTATSGGAGGAAGDGIIVVTYTPANIVSAAGVQASGVARAITPSAAKPLSGVSAAAAAGTVSFTASGNVTAQGVTATGVAEPVSSASAPVLTGVHASGVARAALPNVGANPAGAEAMGVRGNLLIGHTAPVTGVQATGVAHAVTPGVGADPVGVHGTGSAGHLSPTPHLVFKGVQAFGFANLAIPQVSGYVRHAFAIGVVDEVSIFATPISYFPGNRIMRNTPLPGVGEMDNDPVAAVGRLFPKGPQPRSLEVFLEGVEASAHAATVTPFYNVTAHLAGAAAASRAGIVFGIGNVF